MDHGPPADGSWYTPILVDTPTFNVCWTIGGACASALLEQERRFRTGVPAIAPWTWSYAGRQKRRQRAAPSKSNAGLTEEKCPVRGPRKREAVDSTIQSTESRGRRHTNAAPLSSQDHGRPKQMRQLKPRSSQCLDHTTPSSCL